MVFVLLSLLSPFVYGKTPTTYEYTLEYSFENRGTTDFVLTQEDVALPLFINTTGSTAKLDEVSNYYTVIEIDPDGNKGAIVDIDLTLSPGESESFTATYKIMSTDLQTPSFSISSAESRSSIPQALIDEYCFSTETFLSDDPIFYDLATSLTNDDETVLETVSSLVEYIVDETVYCNYETPQYPTDTLKNQQGDCDDQAILLITMCRSLDIPAYLQVGLYVHSSINDQDSSWEDHLVNEADGVGWHGWAMIYIPPWGWVPVDLTLTGTDSGLDLIQSAPEYSSNIIPVLNVSKQPYIGGTLETMERFINSDVYVMVKDKAVVIYSADNPLQNYLLLGLGGALLLAIGLMYKYGNRE